VAPATARSLATKVRAKDADLVDAPVSGSVITRFPAEELLVVGKKYFTVDGPLKAVREDNPTPSPRVQEMIDASVRELAVLE
jgi:hypothetical protein